MKKLFSVMIIVLMSVFLMGPTMAEPTMAVELPDTSSVEGCLLNVADIGELTKYTAVKIFMPQPNLLISYHIGLDNMEPKYVSLLFSGPQVVGFAYYDCGVFHIWAKKLPNAMFVKFPANNKRVQKSFQLDFLRIWPDKVFSLVEGS